MKTILWKWVKSHVDLIPMKPSWIINPKKTFYALEVTTEIFFTYKSSV